MNNPNDWNLPVDVLIVGLGLNIHDLPTLVSRRVGYIPAGLIVTILQVENNRDGTWLKVGRSAWIFYSDDEGTTFEVFEK